MPSAVDVTAVWHRLATGGSCAGDSTCFSTGVSSPVGVGAAVAVGDGVAEGDAVAVAVGEEPQPTTNSSAALAAPAQLPLHRRRDLVPGQVIEPVIMRPHAVR